MFDPFNANELRQWAAHCADKAARADGEKREQLMQMQESLLALAENADWLSGQAETRTFQVAA